MNATQVKNQCANLPDHSVQISISGGKGYCFLKRAVDIVGALLGMVLMLIPGLIIVAAVRLETPGPAFYKQKRLGLNRKPFVIWKFRTMNLHAEDNGPQWAEKNDGRATKVGQFLRNTRLDEIPQLWNILAGDMSFVGPRPERPYFYNIFEEYIPDFGKRMLVKPGLTGWAQVNGGYELQPEEKIVYDLEYIRNQGVKMDILCLLKTFKLVFTHEGAR